MIELGYESSFYRSGSDNVRLLALDHVNKATVVLIVFANNKALLHLR